MNCVIVDDEKRAIDVLKLYVDKLEQLNLVESFNDPVKASQFLRGNQVDLLFLDINMQGLNGFELLETIPNPPRIIFTTAYSEFAVQSYSVNAVDYLVKPISFSRFMKAVNKFEAIVSKSTKIQADSGSTASKHILSIKSGTIIHRIPIDSILYLEADGNYIKVVTENEKIMTLSNMTEMLKLLGEGFFKCHRSFIVAEDKINKVEIFQLGIGEKNIPIGASFRREVVERLNTSS